MKQKTADICVPNGPDIRKRFVIETFEKYERQLTAYALRFFGGRNGDLHAARDIVQFTFLKLCQQEPRSLEGKLLPWLYTVCRNRALDEISSKGKRSQLNPVAATKLNSSEPDPATQFELDDFLRRLPQLLGCLAQTEREVTELWSQGLKPAQVAEVLDKTPGSVRVALHRAIKKLRQHPEVLVWLERATGQAAEPDGKPPSFCNSSNGPSMTGEQS